MKNTFTMAGQTYKIFLVEEDDRDRERVIAGRAKLAAFNIEVDHEDIYDLRSDGPIASYPVETKVICTLEMIRSEDGTYFRIENFAMEEE